MVTASGLSDSRKEWVFSHPLVATPSPTDAACLQVHVAGAFQSPLSVIAQSSTRLALEYTDDTDTSAWRVNGSTAGLVFVGGGSLVTGASGSIT